MLFNICTGTSGFQYSGVPSGEHNVSVRATSTETSEVKIINSTVDLELLAIDISNITGKPKGHVDFSVALIIT